MLPDPRPTFLQDQEDRRSTAFGPLGDTSTDRDSDAIRIPLTDTQREMWFASQISAAVSSSYNEGVTLRLRGPLDAGALARALQQLLDRHEALRARFDAHGEYQLIAPAVDVELSYYDVSESLEEGAANPVATLIDQQVQPTFDLEHGPLLRAALLRVEPEVHLFVWVVHHIICDGWSLGTLMRELGELYAAELEQRPTKLAPPLSLREYASRIAAGRASPEFAGAREFWNNQFADQVPVLELPTDRPRPAERTYAGADRVRAIPPALTTAFKRLCAERECTPFTALFAAFNVLLHRLTTQDDIVVGVPSAAQVMDGAENLVGHFANLLPVRSRIDESEAFTSYLDRFRRQMSGALRHWRYPFGSIIQDLKLMRDPGRMPLASVVFNSSQVRGTLPFGGLAVEPISNPKHHVNFDLNFNCALSDAGFTIGCQYSRELFDQSTIDRWFDHFETLLRSIVAAPGSAIGSLNLLTVPERNRLLRDWNRTQALYPSHECIDDAFFRHARQQPRAVAALMGDRSISYGELAARAQALARQLMSLGVGSDVPVGICLPRSFDQLAAVLGVLAAGGACVPLDPGYPPERLAQMMEGSRAPVLLTLTSLRSLVPAPDDQVTVICLDQALAASPGELPPVPRERSAASLAYVLHTSGSTGRPKGVAMPHRALVNLITWQRAHTRIGAAARTLQFASLSFDVSFQEIFATLSTGGALVLPDEPERRDMRALWRLIAGQQVERVFLPFVALQQLAEAFLPTDAAGLRLREIITAGEPLQVTPKIVTLFTALPGCTLHNHYGPTESHVVTAFDLQGPPDRWPARPSIGKPIANTEIYLVDRRSEPVPIGVPGELIIAGDCLARGYLHQPALTVARFTDHPFRPGARAYRTGDLARHHPDGSIEFIGRIDSQVKLNGYRIELGEIETALQQHPAIKACVVIVREDVPGRKQLVGYAVTSASPAPTPAELRQHLARTLPDYMLPSAFVMLASLPTTPSGKVDRRTLPPPDLSGEGSEASGPEPQSTAEELVADIWRDVLGVQRLGVHANFFELGGHSLSAMQVISRLRDSLGIELSFARFLGAPTIAATAGLVEELLLVETNASVVEHAETSQSSLSAMPF